MIIKVTHLIYGLANGGAETSLYNLVKYQSEESDIEYAVISLGLNSSSVSDLVDYYKDQIEKEGVKVIKVDILHHPFKSFNIVRKEMKSSDLVCGWMYYSNLIAYYIAKLSSVSNLIWFVRHADLSKKNNSKLTLLANKICARKSKSKIVKKIIYNGELAREVHENVGYDKTKSLSVCNGCDLDVYTFNPDSKKKIYAQLGIDESRKIMLSVARYSKIKDVPLFISSLAALKKEHSELVGVMCGFKIEESNDELVSLIKENNLVIGEDIFLLGRINDLPDLFSACELYVLHSAGEAFPNTLIQAMSCECLCVATDVGDVGNIIKKDCIVPPRNLEAMVDKIDLALRLSDDEKAVIRKDNAKAVQEKFNIRNVILTYESIFSEDKE